MKTIKYSSGSAFYFFVGFQYKLAGLFVLYRRICLFARFAWFFVVVVVGSCSIGRWFVVVMANCGDTQVFELFINAINAKCMS